MDAFSLTRPMDLPQSWTTLPQDASPLAVEMRAWMEFGRGWQSERFFQVCAWEKGSFDDTDWYAMIYDAVEDRLFTTQTGTTRYADAMPVRGFFGNPEGAVLEKARKAWALKTAKSNTAHDENTHRAAPHGANLAIGTVYRLDRGTTCGKQVAVRKDCFKCSGSGKWTNPRNARDIRDCLSCAGKGKRTFTNKTNEKITVPANTLVRLVEEPSRFTFGAPLRGTVEILGDEEQDTGVRFQVNIEYLRLTSEPLPLEVHLEWALLNSTNLQVGEYRWHAV